MRKTTLIVSALAIVSLAWLCPMVVAGTLEPSAAPGPTMKTLDEVEPRIPIQSLSGDASSAYIIGQSGSYYFTGDITVADLNKNGITVEANDVTIDLSGYSLIGPGKAVGTSGDGIYMYGRSNIDIRNGTIKDFASNGIYAGPNILENHKGHQVIYIRAISNGVNGIYLSGRGQLIQNCTVAFNGDDGISAFTGCMIKDNIAHNNGDIGISASNSTIMSNASYDNGSDGIKGWVCCTIVNNTVHYNSGIGISAGWGSTVNGNTGRMNNAGIYGDRCQIVGNSLYRQIEDGIEVGEKCIVSNNSVVYSGANGDGACIYVTGSDNRIEGNNVTMSDRGIDVDGTGNIIIKNTASGNTTNYDIIAGNKVGPIATDPNTTTNPWANFEF